MKPLDARAIAAKIACPVLLGGLLASCHSAPALDVAKDVDLKRFQGKWYEIASLPRDTQAQCVGTTEFITLQGDGTLSIVNECKLGSASGSTRSASANGKVPDPSVNAKLSVDFGGGFYGDYWILEVGEHYEYAVVGHPSRDYLWILSRTKTLDAATLSAAIARANSNAFDTSKLVNTPQPD